jgi:hypothetical protein
MSSRSHRKKFKSLSLREMTGSQFLRVQRYNEKDEFSKLNLLIFDYLKQIIGNVREKWQLIQKEQVFMQ